jgi:hypothetical protein
VDADAELLVELPPEAGLERLAGLALPAGKLPQSAEVLARIAPCHEEAPRASHDRRGDLHDGEARPCGQLPEEPEE